MQIVELQSQGMTTEEIADTLYMSVKNVQAYMPYERGVYGGDELSKEAIRSNKYRNRMKKAASMQVIKSAGRDEAPERKEEMENIKNLEFKKTDNGFQKVLKLHLELDMKYTDEDEMQTLRIISFLSGQRWLGYILDFQQKITKIFIGMMITEKGKVLNRG